MIKVLEKDRVKALQKIIQLNPFDAVVMIRNIQTGYVIECVNEKAIQLFQEPEYGKMNAEDFFGVIDWQTLKPFIEKPNGQITYINLLLNNCYTLFLQEMLIDEQLYILIVLRTASKHQQYPFCPRCSL